MSDISKRELNLGAVGLGLTTGSNVSNQLREASRSWISRGNFLYSVYGVRKDIDNLLLKPTGGSLGRCGCGILLVIEMAANIGRALVGAGELEEEASAVFAGVKTAGVALAGTGVEGAVTEADTTVDAGAGLGAAAMGVEGAAEETGAAVGAETGADVPGPAPSEVTPGRPNSSISVISAAANRSSKSDETVDSGEPGGGCVESPFAPA